MKTKTPTTTVKQDTPPFTIIVDTREQKPYQFPTEQKISVKTLHTADYSIEGLEHLVAVEKKRDVTEFAQSVVQKRFWNEIDRLQAFPYPFLLLDFAFSELEGFPFTTSLPFFVKKKIKIRGGFLQKSVARILSKGINVIFTGNAKNSAKLLMQLFKEICDENRTSPQS